jgi:hypothetical protein
LKTDTFILDFRNQAEDIADAFEPWYGKRVMEAWCSQDPACVAEDWAPDGWLHQASIDTGP